MRCVQLFALATLVATSCAAPDPTESPDATTQGDPDPVEPNDPAAGCSAGTHACDATCAPDNLNQVALGCRFGCGQPCQDGANGTATCTPLGTCGLDCNAGYANNNGECVQVSCSASGYLCGDALDDSGHSISCGSCLGTATCTANHICDVAPDALEPNQMQSAATNLGDFNDADDKGRTVAGLDIDEAMDVDWFKFRVIDGFDANNPDVHVGLSLNSGALATNHELTVWFKCDSTDAGTLVRCGEASTTLATNNSNDSTLGVGCTVNAKNIVWVDFESNCTSTDDSGTAYVRVRKLAPPRGDTYDLYLEAK